MDSTKVEIKSKALDLVANSIAEKQDKSIDLNFIIPLLIGAVLTFVTQIIIEKRNSNKEKKIKRRELISKGRAKTYLIAQLLKDLAMYKTHKQYYWRCYKVDIDTKDSYKKHYEKGQEQRITEAKLDEKIAEFFEIVSEYHILEKKKEDFKLLYETIFNYKHPKPNKFQKSTEDDLVAELKEEEERINSIYQSEFISKLNDLQNKMI